ncbi:hypothetical protein AB0I60_01725 [Actinosynnema sp. NPDC050436]|uniref:hypothetical protein n=1 Tax=Actinosynnema sp. NPDC050436 TaxID=3155659 RepID=UPI0033EB154F
MTDDRTAPSARRIDVTRLPADVVALINALRPGEDVIVTRDGNAIATISSAYDGLDDAVSAPGRPDETAQRPAVAYDDVTVVATAMKLPASARASLSAELGPDYIVLDLDAAPKTADVLLVPPISPQLIGHLRALFPKARVIVTDFEDRASGISYPGPIRRLLDAGAETYLAATAIPRLAKQLDHTITRREELAGGPAPHLEIEPPRDTVPLPE